MRKLEFESIMEVLNIPQIKNDPNEEGHVYNWNGFKISYCNLTGEAILKGNIPVKVSKVIKDKYFQKKNEDVLYDYINLQNNCCEIKKKEGLLFFITELQDYYIQKILSNQNIRIQADRYLELTADVYRILIEQTSPYLTTDQWIYNNNIYIFEETKNRQSFDEQDNEIRILLNRFDDAVNPFNNEKVEMLDPSYYVDQVIFDEKSNKQCTINDKKIGIKTDYWNTPKVLRYSVDSLYLTISHTFDKQEIVTKSPDEYIEIGSKGRYYRRISLTQDIIHENNLQGIGRTLTAEDKAFIFSKLQQAIEMAEMVTIKNMTTPKMQNVIKRTLNKE